MALSCTLGNCPLGGEFRLKPLNIAMLAPPWYEVPPAGYGGIEWMCHWLTEGLVRRGHKVTLIGAGEAQTSATFVQTFDEPPTRKLGQALPEAVHLAQAAQVIREGSFDLVHDHTQSGPLLAIGREIPTVATAHGNLVGDLVEYYRWIGNQIRLVAISNSQRTQAPDLPWAGVVYNGIPVADFPYSPIKDDFALFLGRMSDQKGVHIAIDVAEAAGIKLVIAAKLNETVEYDYFEREVKPRLGPNVEWVGEANTETKKELLRDARCLLFPIQWEEPFGYVMVEALASGTPVVALRRGSVSEVITDGLTGFICDEPDEMVSAIHRLHEINPADCRSNAEKRFDIRSMISGYERIFETISRRGESKGKDDEIELIEPSTAHV